jgi:hypothetical protein
VARRLGMPSDDTCQHRTSVPKYSHASTSVQTTGSPYLRPRFSTCYNNLYISNPAPLHKFLSTYDMTDSQPTIMHSAGVNAFPFLFRCDAIRPHYAVSRYPRRQLLQYCYGVSCVSWHTAFACLCVYSTCINSNSNSMMLMLVVSNLFLVTR